MSPSVGLDITQGWPYAPYHAVITALPYMRRGLIFFMALTTLTLLLFNLRIDLWRMLLLASLFSIPSLILMAGGVPLPAPVPMAKFAEYQVRLLPVIALAPVALGTFALRKLPRLPLSLVLLLMVIFLCGYPQISLVTDEQKRNSMFGMVQISMVVYLFGLSLYTQIRSMVQARK